MADEQKKGASKGTKQNVHSSSSSNEKNVISRRKVLATMGLAGLAVASGTAGGAFMNAKGDTSLPETSEEHQHRDRVYDSVASMVSDSSLKDGMYVRTRGYYKPGDGGAAEYFIEE